MHLDEDQIKLIKGITRRRKQEKLTLVMAVVSAIGLGFGFWMLVKFQFEWKEISMLIFWPSVAWVQIFLFPKPPRKKLENMLMEYVNNDAESLLCLNGRESKLGNVNA